MFHLGEAFFKSSTTSTFGGSPTFTISWQEANYPFSERSPLTTLTYVKTIFDVAVLVRG